MIKSYIPSICALYAQEFLAKHLVVNFMSPFLNLGNYIKFFVIIIQVLYRLDLLKFVMKCLHCFLMSKVNVDMNPIPSFLYMNWNELELIFF